MQIGAVIISCSLPAQQQPYTFHSVRLIMWAGRVTLAVLGHQKFKANRLTQFKEYGTPSVHVDPKHGCCCIG